MKGYLSLFTLAFLLFAPTLLLSSSADVSVESICREATTGHQYNFCLSALNRTPMNQTTDIREFAVAAINQLIAYYPHDQLNGGEVVPDYSIAPMLDCIKGMAQAILDLDDAKTRISKRDCNGALQNITVAANMLILITHGWNLGGNPTTGCQEDYGLFLFEHYQILLPLICIERNLVSD